MALFFSDKFICGSTAYSTLEKAVAAPYLRKSFLINSQPEHAEIRICGLGFYELYINGTRITKGALAPYININTLHKGLYQRYHHIGCGIFSILPEGE